MSETLNYHLYDSNELLSIFNEHTFFSITDLNGIITSVSDAFCKETGYERKEILGRTHSFLRAPDFPDKIYKDLWDTITQDEVWKGQINNIKKNGDSYWTNSVIQPIFNHKNKKIAYLSIRQNITKEKSCEELSVIDELTGIFNRRKFNVELNNFLINFYRYDDNFSIIMLDIDHFKMFNDKYGHLIGDEVLKRTAHIIQNNVRQGDFFARWGGEEFVLLLNKIDKKQAINVCKVLLNKVKLDIPQYLYENFNIRSSLTCSLGITSPQKLDSVNSILSRVDRALYSAKDNGRNRIEVL